jgi:hypothetical protein
MCGYANNFDDASRKIGVFYCLGFVVRLAVDHSSTFTAMPAHGGSS